jgi:cytoskeletal protein CcmA (bactofilin family)
MSDFLVNSQGQRDHLDEMAALLFLEKQLDAAREREAAAHFDSCPECRQLLEVLKQETLWMQAAIAGDESLPARLALKPRSVAHHWGWMTAAALGLAGAYTLWAGIVSPWMEQAGQAGFSQGNVLMMLLFSGALWKGWGTMQTAMEFMAAATLLATAYWLFRRYLRRSFAVGVVLSALALTFMLVPPANAADVKHGQPNYILPSGQETHGDLIVAANFTRIDGDVNGDLIVSSASVTVNGHVKGDILGFAQEMRINGTVDGNLRAMCHSIILNGTVAKNVSSFAQNFDMDGKARVGGSILLGANDAELDGRIGSDLFAFAHSLDLDGALGGDAQVRAQDFNIGSEANIAGHTKYVGPSQPNVASGAKLGSPPEVTIRRPGPSYASPRFYWHEVLYWGVLFVFGLVMLLAAPGFFFDAARSTRRIGPSFGFGAICLIGTPIAVVIACATIVGLAVGITTFLCYVVALFAAQIFVSEWIGEKLLGPETGIGHAAGRLAIGLGIVRILTVLPFAGPLIRLAVMIWGLGAIVLAVHRRTRTNAITPVAA